MTNAEKYKEVFGFEPDFNSCMADECYICPLRKNGCISTGTVVWWNSEYKEMKGGAEE